MAEFQKRKREEVTHPHLEQKTSLGRIPFLQARIFARHLRGDLADYHLAHSARADLLRDYGLEWTNADQSHTMGVSSADWAAYMAGRLDHRMTDEQVMEAVVSRIEATYRAQVPLMPGAREAGRITLMRSPTRL